MGLTRVITGPSCCEKPTSANTWLYVKFQASSFFQKHFLDILKSPFSSEHPITQFLSFEVLNYHHKKN